MVQTVELFSPHPLPLVTESVRRLRVSQSGKVSRRWRGKYCFASRDEQIIGGYPKTITSLELSLVAKYSTRFIRRFSQLNSDIQCYRCKNFSFKQVLGLMGGGGSETPVPSPWILLLALKSISAISGK